LDRVSDYESEG